ncbi:hypothetical protein JRC04_04795 [Mycolicibacterium sp. S2-37]|uniref:hypothetical protein n=1 Tax=Mycolicibacterium sp. S2-37 TaxID=2810297 RepID=UPI001A93FE4C|nr:hypothetical protein [Mycolicibacterium sp. S2-37]MBO0676777.1 hypothetical protein [Mycolicibacterium sp. S2-37]
MAIIVNEAEGTISFTDTTVTFPYGFETGSGTGTIIITPAGGVANFPLAIEGSSGPSAKFRNITIVEVDPTQSLPSPNPVVTEVTPGGPGESTIYDLQFYLHRGNDGATGTMSILGANDIDITGSNPPATANYMLIRHPTDETKMIWAAQPMGDLFVPGNIPATAFTNTSPRLIATVTVPAQPFSWRPRVSGQFVISGSSDTRVDAVARLNNPETGDVVGYAFGQAGAAPPPLNMSSGVPAGSNAAYGKVAPGVAATIYIRAEQKAASSNNWSTPAASAGAWVAVEVLPVP